MDNFFYKQQQNFLNNSKVFAFFFHFINTHHNIAFNLSLFWNFKSPEFLSKINKK